LLDPANGRVEQPFSHKGFSNVKEGAEKVVTAKRPNSILVVVKAILSLDTTDDAAWGILLVLNRLLK
jgi:hypothetical protein